MLLAYKRLQTPTEQTRAAVLLSYAETSVLVAWKFVEDSEHENLLLSLTHVETMSHRRNEGLRRLRKYILFSI